jgi:hypothetical protein
MLLKILIQTLKKIENNSYMSAKTPAARMTEYAAYFMRHLEKTFKTAELSLKPGKRNGQ